MPCQEVGRWMSSFAAAQDDMAPHADPLRKGRSRRERASVSGIKRTEEKQRWKKSGEFAALDPGDSLFEPAKFGLKMRCQEADILRDVALSIRAARLANDEVID